MSLFKQIALLVSLMFILLVSIIIVNDLRRTATFLQGQLQTTAQDMTTTLGIAVSNLPSTDKATLEVLFNSVFDSGYYSNIQLISVDGSVIHEKTQEIIIDGIPEWFLKMVHLSPAQGSTQVMQGWTQLGELKLELHPGFAYSGLYNSLISTLKWFGLIFFGAILILWVLLHYLLLPLQRVKQQADSIHQNQFVQQNKIPGTSELKSVVIAMNEMVSKVQSVFNDQESTISRYHQLLYKDKLSGLANRRYMLDYLQQSLAEESPFHGSFGVIKLVNFELMHDKQGYQFTDQLIQHLATLIEQKHAGLRAEKTARLSDDELSFLVPADEDSVAGFIKSIFSEVKNTALFDEMIEEGYLVAAVTVLNSGLVLGDLLASIDYCLSSASSEGPYSIEQKISSNLNLPKGKIQWRAWLDETLKSDRLFLVGQSAVDQADTAKQMELFVRTRNEQGQIIPASVFMPMASSLGMAIDIDKAVFKLITQYSSFINTVPLAVNLSASFFDQGSALDELDYLSGRCHEQGIQLCIEASHHILNHHPEMCHQVSDRIKKYGHQFGVDNLDLGLSLQLLKTTQFNYIKVNAKTLSDLNSEGLSSSYQALKTLTNTMDINIIAVAVDSELLFNQLKSMGIQIMQGNYLHEPEILAV